MKAAALIPISKNNTRKKTQKIPVTAQRLLFCFSVYLTMALAFCVVCNTPIERKTIDQSCFISYLRYEILYASILLSQDNLAQKLRSGKVSCKGNLHVTCTLNFHWSIFKFHLCN